MQDREYIAGRDKAIEENGQRVLEMMMTGERLTFAEIGAQLWPNVSAEDQFNIARCVG